MQDPVPLSYEVTPPPRQWRRSIAWIVISLWTALLALPISVGVTAAVEDIARGSSSWESATTLSERIGFCLAGAMFLFGIAFGIRARQLVHREGSHQRWGYMATATTTMNAFGLGMTFLIGVILDGKW